MGMNGHGVCPNLFDFSYVSDKYIIIHQIIQLLYLHQVFYIVFSDHLHINTPKDLKKKKKKFHCPYGSGTH